MYEFGVSSGVLKSCQKRNINLGIVNIQNYRIVSIQMENEKWASEDEMAGWNHRCKEHELGQTPGDGEERGGVGWGAVVHGVSKSWT